MIFGIVLGVIMNAAITYAGLKIGFTITGSAIAAVLGFGVLRALLRRGTILEVNMAQTVASTVNTITSGIIFTVPVLFLFGPKNYPSTSSLWLIILACAAGAVMGCAFIVPLRKQMIEIDRLRFPTGTAMGVILRAPGAGGAKSLVLLGGAIFAAVLFYPTASTQLRFGDAYALGYADLGWRMAMPATPPPGGDEGAQKAYESARRRADHDGDGKGDLIVDGEEFHLGRLLHLPDFLALTLAISPLSFGAGYLSGRPGLMVLAGGILAYWILAPAAYMTGFMPPTVMDHQVTEAARTSLTRPLGIGMLLGGAMMGIFAALPAMKAALKSIASAAKLTTEKDELDLKTIVLIAAPCMVVLFLAAQLTRTEGDLGWLGGLPFVLQNVVITIVGVVWIWFAGIIISQCTGMTDWSPISGIALLTVVLVMLLGGTSDVIGAVLVGATLCCATTASADMMTDLKTGQIIGARPRRQQISQTLTAAIGPFVSLATLLVIMSNNMAQTKTEATNAAIAANRPVDKDFEGIPIGPGTETPAPQAVALKTVIEGMQGGELPYALYGVGSLLGVLLGVGAFSGLGVLVGISMYLPFHSILTYGFGCVTQMIVARIKGPDWAEEWGVPVCAGFVIGEGLLAIAIAGLSLVLPAFAN
jgi:uncharacterized oligopeptide transporter (OPT) family protein